MQISTASAFSLAFNGAAPALRLQHAAAAVTMETKADLEALAIKLNPTIGYWDPLKLADQTFWGQSNEATIGFLRQAELKHGRVAMAGFVGYCVHATGFTWPWPMSSSVFGQLTPPGQLATEGSRLVPNPSWFPVVNGGKWPELVDGDVPALWDALSDSAKLQIFAFIFLMEIWGETDPDGTNAHYMKGGRPGVFPSFDKMPHPVPLNLFDPFKLTAKMSPEKKEKSLLAEINNGRLAMIGLMAFVTEAKVPGAVPALTGIIKSSDASSIAMQPFTHPIF